VLAARPDAATWSAMEYLGHLRDLMAFHRHAIEQAPAPGTIDIRLIMRSAVHEGIHHQGDLSQLVGHAR
jgi:hypothetical protein